MIKMEINVRDMIEVYLNGDPKLAGKFRAYHINIDDVIGHWNFISEVWDDAQKEGEEYLIWIDDNPNSPRLIDLWAAEDTSLSSISERLLHLVDWEAEYATRSAKGEKWGGWTVKSLSRVKAYKMIISSLLERGLEAPIKGLKETFWGLMGEEYHPRRRVVWNTKESRLEYGNSLKEGEEIARLWSGDFLTEEAYIIAMIDGFWGKIRAPWVQEGQIGDTHEGREYVK